MPALPNARHERFAQALAAGESASEAYVTAGFAANRGNAATLKQKQSILKRVSELLVENVEITHQATSAAIAAVAISKQWVLSRLVENAERAMQATEVKRDGVGSGEYKYEGSVANKALELIGKHLGMFIERKEIGGPGEFDDADQLRASIAADLGISAEALEAARRAGKQGGLRGKPH